MSKHSFSPRRFAATACFLVLASQGAYAQDATQPAAQEAAPPPAVQAPAPVVSLPVFPVTYSRHALDGSSKKPEMDSLRVVHQANTHAEIGKQVAINVGLAILTGGMSFAFQTFGKGDLAGDAPDGAVNTARLTNPALSILPTELSRATAAWLATHPTGSTARFNKPLVATSAAWRLVYNSLDGNDATYRLQLDVGIHKQRERSTWPMPNVRGGKACAYASEPRPLAQWKADDYQAVVDLADVAVAYCVKEFVGQMAGLLELE